VLKDWGELDPRRLERVMHDHLPRIAH
jgi:hypothetical protein